MPGLRLSSLFQLVMLAVLPDVPDIARRSYVALFIETYLTQHRIEFFAAQGFNDLIQL